jgi:hypothetical protein
MMQARTRAWMHARTKSCKHTPHRPNPHNTREHKAHKIRHKLAGAVLQLYSILYLHAMLVWNSMKTSNSFCQCQFCCWYSLGEQEPCTNHDENVHATGIDAKRQGYKTGCKANDFQKWKYTVPRSCSSPLRRWSDLILKFSMILTEKALFVVTLKPVSKKSIDSPGFFFSVIPPVLLDISLHPHSRSPWPKFILLPPPVQLLLEICCFSAARCEANPRTVW